MGWGQLLGDFAKGFAKGYVEERGIVGTVQDVAGIGKSLLGSNNESYDEEALAEAYNQDWDNTVDAINTCIENGNFNKAKSVLSNFYSKYEEEHDFWYAYHTARILYFEWNDAAKYLLADKNHDEMVNGKAKQVYSNFKFWLTKLQNQVSEANEVKSAEELASAAKDDNEVIEYILEEHKLWNKIYAIEKPGHVAKGTKTEEFKKALKDVENFYNSGYDYYKGIVRVYILMLRTASNDNAFCTELAPKYDEIIESASSAAEKMGTEADTSDAKELSTSSNLRNSLKKWMEEVGEKVKKTTQVAKSTQNIQTAAKVNDKEQEYLEEIKACLADDGEISSRERRILDRLRDSLGISEQRAKELEDSLSSGSLTDNEKEYMEALKESMTDGVISQRERRLLEKLRISMGISEERAKELEKTIS